MSVFRTTNEILNRAWDTSAKIDKTYTWQDLPKQVQWNKEKSPSIEDIETWEEIYYQCGSLGIYAAWSPYTEFYILVHCLFSDKKQGIEIYKGPNAGQQLKERASYFGLTLPINKIWVDHDYNHNVIPISA